MAQRKAERLMNLVICLLVARTYVPRERIRTVVEGYADQTDEAFERMFERDKEDLRELGIPIETGTSPAAFDEVAGYRIRRREYELPPITLEPDEAAVLGLAARLWQHASLAEATSRGLLKLRAAGVQTDPGALAMIEPHVAAEEPAFWPLWQAVRDRQPVAFPYRSAAGAGAAPRERRIEPWSVLSWHGRWYVVGLDLERGAPRLFRLDRVTGDVVRGEPGGFDPPDAAEVRAAAARLAPQAPTGAARLAVRAGTGWGLRRRALSVRPGRSVADRDEVVVPFADGDLLAEEVAEHGADVVVLDPPQVRQRVLALLRAAAGDGWVGR